MKTALRLAAVAALAAVPLTVSAVHPVRAAQQVAAPAGAIAGVGTAPGLTLAVRATTQPEHLGGAVIDVAGRRIDVRFDCVRTYSMVGLILSVPIVNEIGYASGVGTDGRRWYVYVNQGFAFQATTAPGPAVAHESCGVGYAIGAGVPAIDVVGERTTAWTPVG